MDTTQLANLTVFTKDQGFVRYGDVSVGLLTHGLNYGTGCFEGVRGFWNVEDRELYLLHLAPHYQRLTQSAKILNIDLGMTVDQMVETTVELCARNRFESDVYIRPLAYKAGEDIGVRLHGVKDALAIVAIPFNRYIDTEGGLNVCTSSWRRIDDCSIPARAKVTGAYINSALAKSEAQQNGFDEAIMLSADGHVAEGSAENFFMLKNGALVTPDESQNILEGITRSSIIEIARNVLGLEVRERAIDRTEIYGAQEVFLTGSAAGVAPIVSLDRRPIGNGKIGPVTAQIMEVYESAVRGREPRYRSWVVPAYGARKVTTA
ncbi:MAG TPA: branched-chain amino acid transaminase [Candidatus Dormibacteraeota bacterium]|nr:branched-chain amino acid transaminase [Candidatus Dormibacteraeota bacterium]